MRAAAVALARELERRRPELCTWAWWKEERGARVFVDYNQNAPHKTVFAAWGARARVGGQVSAPFAWDELDTVDPGRHDDRVGTRPRGRAGDPWATIGDQPRTLVAARAVGARPGERHDGRAVAAGVSQAAERAAAGRAEPRA